MTDSDLLPVTAYSEPKAFQAERRGLFGRGWHPIAPLGALSQPGAYVALGYGGHPVFAMTGDDGTPRVFKNVCAHQQMLVLDNGRGVCERLRCRFHGWTYDRAGVLVSAPPPVAPDGDLSDHPLARCPSEATTALLCAAFEPDPVPFDPAPWAAADKLADMTLVGSQTAALAVNWKSVIDILVGESGLAGT